MILIDEIDGKLINLWKFWSVRLNVLSGACSGAVAAYEGFKALDPALVKDVPEFLMGALATGAVLFTFASLVSRGLVQPKLRAGDDNAEHA